MGACGSQTSAIAFGGITTVPVSSSESWNGTSWTSTPSLNTARRSVRSSIQGTQTSALAFMGSGPTGATELWNGSTWTNNPNSMGTSRTQGGGTGTQIAALAFGGETGPALTTATEEFSGPGTATAKTITTS